jgi:SAM-dependent methyltransferase
MQLPEIQPQPAHYDWMPQDCPICLQPPTRFLGMRGGEFHRQGLGCAAKIWRCSGCGLIFPNPMPVPRSTAAQHYDVSADDYFEHHDLGRKEASSQQRLADAERLLPGKGRLLDIGAGRGELLREALHQGWEAVGVEPSPRFAEYAARYSGAEVKPLKLKQCDFYDASFDVVILAAVLEHLYDPVEVVQEIVRILKPGGLLFLDVPNEVGLYFQLGNLYQRLRGRDWVVNLAPTFSPFHVFGFTPKSLRVLLAQNRLTPVKWLVYGGTSMVPAGKGMMGMIERTAATLVTKASGLGEAGTYIETWARKDAAV